MALVSACGDVFILVGINEFNDQGHFRKDYKRIYLNAFPIKDYNTFT